MLLLQGLAGLCQWVTHCIVLFPAQCPTPRGWVHDTMPGSVEGGREAWEKEKEGRGKDWQKKRREEKEALQRNQFQKVSKVMCIGRDTWSCMHTYVRTYVQMCVCIKRESVSSNEYYSGTGQSHHLLTFVSSGSSSVSPGQNITMCICPCVMYVCFIA